VDWVRGMTTMKDVARRVGVDTSTVSRALSGDKRRAPKRETRERILAAAHEMGYRPNSVGRMLRTRRTETIGLVVPDISNPGFAEIFAGVREVILDAGYHVVVVDGRDAAKRGVGWDGLAVEGRVDGLLILTATIRDSTVLRVARSGFPLVLVNRRSRGVGASVVMNDAKGAAVAVGHLAGIGHRRIAHIAGPANVDTGRRRLAGFRTAMADHGLPIRDRWIAETDYTLVGGARAAEQLLTCSGESMPTGLYVSSMLSALGALSVFDAAGIRVPEDLSVVVSDEIEIAGHWKPPLTTIAMPLSHMGAEAARMLLAAIDGKPGADIVIPDEPRLIVRSSTRPL
jgi:LacI family transcriptional regulator